VGYSTDLAADDGYLAYVWSSGEVTEGITASAPGVYTVTVTALNGCTGTASVTVFENAAIIPTISGDLSYCAGDNTTLTASSGYVSYEWTTGSADPSITVTAGAYGVTVTDVNGCTATATVEVMEDALPIPVISGDLTYCAGGSATLDVGPGYVSYSWSPFGQTTESIEATLPGDYTVTVVDVNGCEGSATVTVIENALPTPQIGGAAVICEGSSTILDAGAGYASYQWSTGSQEQTISTDQSGAYVVTVTDGNGCEASANLTVSYEAPLDVDIAAPEVLTCDVQQTILDASGTEGAVAYQWTTVDGVIEAGAATATPTVSAGGTYDVTVFSALGCPTQGSITVAQNPNSITGLGLTIVEPVCYGDSTAVIAIDSVIGGVAPFVYSMDTFPLTENPVFTGLGAGEYDITVLDAEGCEYTETVLVSDPPQVTVSLLPLDTLIHLGDSVQLTGFVNPDAILGDTIWNSDNAGGLSCEDCFDPWAMPMQTTPMHSPLMATDTMTCSWCSEASEWRKSRSSGYSTAGAS
jgi:hypothetical protein